MPPRPAILLAIAVLSLPAHAMADSSTNIDSGIGAAQCVESGSALLMDCTSTSLRGQDGQLGRDASPETNRRRDGALGFSYTKICNSGSEAGEPGCPDDPPLGPGPNEWACTRDNLTGLIWEVKTRSGLRSMHRRYTNYSAAYNPLGRYGAADDMTGYAERVNAEGLCGGHDWGPGHAARTMSIVHYGRAAGVPHADTTYFPNTVADWTWNSSENPSRADTAWAVDFATGAADNSGVRDLRRPVRLVRWYKIGVHLTISPDGTEVVDDVRGASATWRRCVEGMAWNGSTCAGQPLRFTFEEALQAAQDAAAATGQGWHVPGVKELNWIVRKEQGPPAIDITFPATPIGIHCTSTPVVHAASRAWAVDFSAGGTLELPRTKACYLRLLR